MNPQTNKTMRAVITARYGAPEVARIDETPKLVPNDDEILVKIRAATVNRTDCAFRSAEHFANRLLSGLFAPRNPTLGNEFAGDVESIGKNATSFNVGDKVFGYNDATFGAHAEYIAIGENKAVARMPSNFTYEEAAPMTEGGHYALSDIKAMRIQSGQKALVYGATGAIGSAAVQLLKYFGAEVTAVCGSNGVEIAKTLGADAVIDYTKQDFTAIGERFDVVYDAVGKSSFARCKTLLKDKGIYKPTELGKNGVNVLLALITPFLGGKKVIFPIPTISKDDLAFFAKLAEEGKYKPLIDRSYDFEDIVSAYRYAESGQKLGNLTLLWSPPAGAVQ